MNMTQGHDYIATWFYRESAEEASFYPQAGGRGDSSLLHSVYMQILVPFFTTFRHYNPQARLLFFTNLTTEALPEFLHELFRRTRTEIVTQPYTCRPPKGWYKAWMNQFYVYDVMERMNRRMQPGDTLLICDADCLCRTPLDELFKTVRLRGSALYEMYYPSDYSINGTTPEEMAAFYTTYYGTPPSSALHYYGGEFIALSAEAAARVCREFPALWKFNFSQPADRPRLHEEAHMLSVMAERLHLRNDVANRYVKRMWTGKSYHNIQPGDELMPVWHVPAEKKFGLYRLYRLLEREKGLRDEKRFWKKAGICCGIPYTTMEKRLQDMTLRIKNKISSLIHG